VQHVAGTEIASPAPIPGKKTPENHKILKKSKIMLKSRLKIRYLFCLYLLDVPYRD
jgi:hypothetical protein